MEQFLVFAVPLAAFGLFGLWSYKSIRSGRKAGFGGLVTLWGAFTLFMILAMYNATGWDGIIYAIGLVFISAPSAIGTGVGALTGWLKLRNQLLDAPT